MATFAPSGASRFAIAAPMPREPPVTSATFFASLDMDLLCFSVNNSLIPPIQPTAILLDPVRIMNHSVLYDDEGAARMQKILNYLVLYRIICLWDARRTLAERKCWKGLCLSSGSMDFRTRVFRTWSEPQA